MWETLGKRKTKSGKHFNQSESIDVIWASMERTRVKNLKQTTTFAPSLAHRHTEGRTGGMYEQRYPRFLTTTTQRCTKERESGLRLSLSDGLLLPWLGVDLVLTKEKLFSTGDQWRAWWSSVFYINFITNGWFRWCWVSNKIVSKYDCRYLCFKYSFTVSFKNYWKYMRIQIYDKMKRWWLLSPFLQLNCKTLCTPLPLTMMVWIGRARDFMGLREDKQKQTLINHLFSGRDCGVFFTSHTYMAVFPLERFCRKKKEECIGFENWIQKWIFIGPMSAPLEFQSTNATRMRIRLVWNSRIHCLLGETYLVV